MLPANLRGWKLVTRITVVNDNPDFLELMHEILESDEHEATTIDGDRSDALELIVASRPSVLIIDIRLGADKLHGWDVGQQVRREPALEGVSILLCSADVAALGALAGDLEGDKRVATLAKPFTLRELEAAIAALQVAAVA